MRVAVYTSVCLTIIVGFSIGDEQKVSSDEAACGTALEQSEHDLKQATGAIVSLTKALVVAAYNMTKLEEDLNLVVYGTRTVYDSATGHYEAVMCEHKSTQITCHQGKVLKIISADYGRHDTRTCFHTEIYTTNCSSNKTMPYISKKCDSNSSCRVAANYLIFGDPCVYTHKYLKVVYKCV